LLFCGFFRTRGRKSLNSPNLGCHVRKVSFTVHSKDAQKMKQIKNALVISNTYVGMGVGAVERLSLLRNREIKKIKKNVA